jgi:hypothetical protein
MTIKEPEDEAFEEIQKRQEEYYKQMREQALSRRSTFNDDERIVRVGRYCPHCGHDLKGKN